MATINLTIVCAVCHRRFACSHEGELADLDVVLAPARLLARSEGWQPYQGTPAVAHGSHERYPMMCPAHLE